MQTIKQFWNGFRLLPSAWLLLVQLALLILATITYDDSAYRALTWSLGVLALLIIAKSFDKPQYLHFGDCSLSVAHLYFLF